MKTKICHKCYVEKSLNEFWNDCTKKDGHCNICIECCKKRIRIYTINDKIKKHNHYLNRKEKILNEKQLYYQDNKIKISIVHKKYYKNNKKRLNKLSFLAYQKRARFDVTLRIKSSLKSRLILALKRNWKSGHTLDLLGCSIDYFKKHLESQFKDGMSWKNYGRGWNGKKEWHIDHIYPCDSFDLSKSSEQKICFHWSNLQPMWAKDNLRKGNKI